MHFNTCRRADVAPDRAGRTCGIRSDFEFVAQQFLKSVAVAEIMTTSVDVPPICCPKPPPAIVRATGPLQPCSVRHTARPFPYSAATMKPAFFCPGIMAMHFADSSSSRGIARSGVFISSWKTFLAARIRLISLLLSAAYRLAPPVSALKASAQTIQIKLFISNFPGTMARYAPTSEASYSQQEDEANAFPNICRENIFAYPHQA